MLGVVLGDMAAGTAGKREQLAGIDREAEDHVATVGVDVELLEALGYFPASGEIVEVTLVPSFVASGPSTTRAVESSRKVSAGCASLSRESSMTSPSIRTWASG
jgi:hypothetical protein